MTGRDASDPDPFRAGAPCDRGVHPRGIRSAVQQRGVADAYGRRHIAERHRDIVRSDFVAIRRARDAASDPFPDREL